MTHFATQLDWEDVKLLFWLSAGVGLTRKITVLSGLLHHCLMGENHSQKNKHAIK